MCVVAFVQRPEGPGGVDVFIKEAFMMGDP
jgi:hypothetical protein